MGKIIQSLALPSLFPGTATSVDALEATLRWLKKRHPVFTVVEYYTAPGQESRLASLFEELGYRAVYIAVLPLKTAGFSLCAADEAERQQAVQVLKDCIDRAAAAGAERVMINSGFVPEDQTLTEKSCESYVKSVLEGTCYIEEKGYGIVIELEPGDSCVQSFQLLGPTDRVIDTTREIARETALYTLAMDTAHIREEGEDVMASLRQTKPWCNHIHLCNCVMDNPAHPLYGDKHVDFDCGDACFTYADFDAFYRQIAAMYADEEVIITLEITCRAEDNNAWFDGVVKQCPWLL